MSRYESPSSTLLTSAVRVSPKTGIRARPERERRRRRGVAGAFAVLGIAVLAAVGATPDLQPLTRIDIVTLNRLAIARTNGAYVLRVQATFRNRHPRDLRLRDGRFAVRLAGNRSPGAAALALGDGRVVDLLLPAAGDGRSGFANAEIEVRMGPEDASTVARAMEFWNLLGDPANAVTLTLSGSAEVGQRLREGWVFDGTNRVGAELRFQASTQRDVLVY